MKLVIFDLDQTLVDFIEIHDKVTRILFRELFGVDARLTEIDFSGKSLNENFYKLARLKNIPEEIYKKKSRGLLENYETTFNKRLPADTEKYILPGVKELLDKLAKTDHIIVLYTGDSQKIVETVFKATGLGKYFQFYQYGTEVKNRTDMVKLAINKAKKLTGRNFRGKEIVIIGDSTQDIKCGKPFNALTIGVATGYHSSVQLLAAGPDYLFDNLKDCMEVLKAIEQLGPVI